jgi:hypothetical protein
VAEYPWTTDYAQNIATPAVWQDHVVVTAGYNHQSICLLKISLRGAQKIWEQPHYSKICSPVIHDGHIYWVYRYAMCLDLNTGRTVWRAGGRFGDAGSCIVSADQRLILWANRGDLVLAETAQRSPNAYRELARVDGLFRRDVWPHVVLADGRLYGKDRDGNMKCFPLNPSSGTDTAPLARADPVTPPDMGPDTHDSSSSGIDPVPDTDEESQGLPASSLRTWPGSMPGLVMAWQRTYGPQRIVSTVDDSYKKWRLETRGNARFVGRGQAQLAGGAVLVQGVNDTLCTACKRSGQLSIEAVILPAKVGQTGPARIISFSQDPYHRNVTLGQDDDTLVLRLRTPQTGENGTNPEVRLFPVQAGKPVHVIVSYRDGQLVAYRNGQRVQTSSRVRGDLSNWTPQHLLMGDEYQGSRAWHGQIERVAIHSRFIDQVEARQRFAVTRAKRQ